MKPNCETTDAIAFVSCFMIRLMHPLTNVPSILRILHRRELENQRVYFVRVVSFINVCLPPIVKVNVTMLIVYFEYYAFMLA